MPENMKRYFQKEEEFLDEYPDIGGLVAKFLENAWQPDFACDDRVRKNRAYFLSTGELQALTYDGAAVYHDQDGFSSVQISLRSSHRVVTVRVRKRGNELVAEKIVDRPVTNEE